MASDLIEMAREVGGDELAERIERLQDEIEEVEHQIEADLDEDQELGRQLIEEGEFTESTVEGMSLQAKREVAEATGLQEESVNVRIPVAGRFNEEPTEDEEVTINRSSPRTYTEEVPIEGGENPETMTVEYEEQGPSLEAVNEFHGWLNRERSEETRRHQERVNERREKQMSGAIPNYEYLNEGEGEVDESEIPAPGEIQREANDE